MLIQCNAFFALYTECFLFSALKFYLIKKKQSKNIGKKFTPNSKGLGQNPTVIQPRAVE